MFFPSDCTTEIVAHFLGYFEMRLEEMRLRTSYEEFISEPTLSVPESELEQISVPILQQFKLNDYLPGMSYVAPHWDIRGNAPVEGRITAPQTAGPIDVPSRPLPSSQLSGEPRNGTAENPPPLIGEEAGSVIAVISQQLSLSDNDIVVLGDYGGSINFQSGAPAGIASLYSAATTVGAPIGGIAALNSVTDAATLVEQTARFVDALETSSGAHTPQTDVVLIENIEGTYVNGEIVAENVDLATALPEQWRAEVEEDEPEEHAVEGDTIVQGDDVVDSITLKSGGNLLVNEVAFLNAGVTSTFLAVAGDYHQLDVIIQTNAFSDIDIVGEAGPGAAGNSADTTSSYNVATFAQQVRDSASIAADANPGAMPLNWQVSAVAGDLIFIEWLTQFTFYSDEDVHVLSSTGTTTSVTTGENVGINGISFSNIGLYYDLIIIGGDLYDANIILQTNVLYDNDTLELLAGSDRDDGGVSTSGNLLWNQASILNVGATEFQSGIPAHYQQAADRLDDGDYRMPDGFEYDGQFQGFDMLRVLYVAGDVFDVRYVKQTNVLGDADYVAVQEAQLRESHPGTVWDISTGSNALVNIAAIEDYDGIGDTASVGGEIYSDAILIQADILAGAPDNSSGDALVSEVIAFLETDAVDDTSPHDIGPDHAPADGPPADILQTMLA